MNTANTKAVTVELITTCWAPLISCPCQQDLPSAKNYPYTCTTSTFAGCLGARNTGHICMCLYVSDINWQCFLLGTHLQSPASPPIFCRFAIVIWNDLNIFQFRAKGAFGVHPMIWSKMCRRTPFLSTWHGMDQTWVSTKLDGLRWFNLVLKPYSQLWLHGVSLYLNLESGLNLASGWNLCCAAISFIASHLSFPSVMDLLWLVNSTSWLSFNGMTSWAKDRDMTSRSKP